ncbi:uncharacterized protein C1orf109-like [Argonauta hians]
MPDVVQVQKTEAFKCKLRNAFVAVQQCKTVWQECASQEEVQLKELINLCEQYQCCYDANMESVSRGAKDVKPRLLYVIGEKIEEKLREVDSTMTEFQNSYDKVNQARVNAFEDKPNMASLTMRLTMCPSMATLLEWIDDIERQIFAKLQLKKYFLDEIQYGDVSVVQQLLNSWCHDDSKVINSIQEKLLYLEDFIKQR